MEKEQECLIGLKYVKVFFVAFYIALVILYKQKMTFEYMIIFLCYVANIQVRALEYIRERKLFLALSIGLESIFACGLFEFMGFCGGALFMPAVLDLIYFWGSRIGALYSFILVLGVAFKGESIITAFTIIEIFPLSILAKTMKEQNNSKLKAQTLYDTLRSKEIELRNANKELESYADNIEELTVLRERNRISREIHDNVGHALSTIIIQLKAIQSMTKEESKEVSEMAGVLSEFAKDSLEDVRNAVKEMRPREFEENEGYITLIEMTKNFEKLTGIRVKLDISNKRWRLNADQMMMIYRITQEFLSNSLRHGKATSVKIFLNFTDQTLNIYLKDNGIGANKIEVGNGLRGMQQRVQTQGGSFQYRTWEGGGFELTIVLEKGKLMIDEA